MLPNSTRSGKYAFVFALLVAFAAVDAVASPAPPSYGNMKVLFCAYGSIGQQPLVLPSGFENQFAEAVFEVNSSGDWRNAPLPTITLFDAAGNAVMTKRVVSVEVFDEPYVQGEGNGAFYLDTNKRGGTHAWDRVLHGGMTHLRVRVALNTQRDLSLPSGRCRIDFGTEHIEGPIDGPWPTG